MSKFSPAQGFFFAPRFLQVIKTLCKLRDFALVKVADLAGGKTWAAI